jgi:hypothetical protein
MNVELIISKDRVPYIVEELGTEKVTVSKYDEEQDKVSFELTSPIDVLYMFHAGIRCGSENMAKALTSKVV